ncbi:MAG: AAA family ATPase [Albidovulum sp.]|nr:AAA family ATPase [Albidovulum sp.]
MIDLVAPKPEGGEDGKPSRQKILYYNAFTEDLFYWDNDLLYDDEPKLMIQPNTFTDWILGEQGKGNEIIANFQHYTNRSLTPIFLEADKVQDGRKTGEKTYPSVSFSIATGDDLAKKSIKISKGEESSFVWSIFYTLIEEVVNVLSVPEVAERSTNQFDNLKFIFVDDPVTSLDDNHLIELAQSLATLINSSPKDEPKFIITTHNPLFYNVLFNALKKSVKYRLLREEDGSFPLKRQNTDSPFSYHLHLIEKLNSAFEKNEFEKYHYNFLRNVLEKISTFLGYDDWSELLPKTSDGASNAYLKCIVDISSHSSHSSYEMSELSQDDKRVLRFLLSETTNKQYEFSEKYQVDLKAGTPGE